MPQPAMNREELLAVREQLDRVVVNSDDEHRVYREVYTAPRLFDLEMEFIFEDSWVYFAHESQIRKPHDYLTGKVGRQPVVVTRQQDGTLRGFLNACTHRGALLYRERRGNAKIKMCGFHGWCFNSSGKLVDVKEEETGFYPASFDRDELGLKTVRVESYRGFIFVNLGQTYGSLPDYLGEATKFIDMIVDQSPTGEIEVLRGMGRYTFQANWKVSVEGGQDGYHPFPVHASFIESALRRAANISANKTAAMDISRMDQLDGGCMCFKNGHSVLWIDYANSEVRPQYPLRAGLAHRFGESYAKWVVDRVRNLGLFPNVVVMDAISGQIRVTHPVCVDRTLVETFCIAPVGESSTAREARIRQYEDFYNASGTATPDDLVEFNYSQAGFQAHGVRSTDLSRGMGSFFKGANSFAKEIGVEPISSSDNDPASELLYNELYSAWRDRMIQGIERQLQKTP